MRSPAVCLLFAALFACQSDVTSTQTELDDARSEGGPASASHVVCPACTFEPELYTRTTATPVTEVVEFEANPAGAYLIDIDDLGTRGANATVVLNGEPLDVRTGKLQGPVELDWENRLETRLTGKPGSKLSVRIYQEVASVEVTPGTASGLIPTTRQFTAVAYDRNGVTIPRQTFTWRTGIPDIATVGAQTGLARTTGPVHRTGPFDYTTVSTGEGAVRVIAHADESDREGSGVWTVAMGGFVYVTWRPPLPDTSPRRHERPLPEPYRYDEARLQAMAGTCAGEASNTAWHPDDENTDRFFQQCFEEIGVTTPRRDWHEPTLITPGFYTYAVAPNVGVYGRYCGGGHPAGGWWDLAAAGNYGPKDAIDALCLEHDRSWANHELDPSDDAVETTCIVLFGILTEQLFENGVEVDPGSARWNVFWSRYPEMAGARDHWLVATSGPCALVYEDFLGHRF